MNKIDLIKQSRLHKIFKPFFSGIGNIIVFHRVSYDNDSIMNNNLMVSPEYLENVLQYFISNKIDIVDLDECYHRINSNCKVKRFVAFTFDDGYKDNLINALPVFEKYDAPLAIFLATGFPDQKIAFLPDSLEKLVLNRKYIEFSDGDENYFFDTMSKEGKIDAFYTIRKYIRKSNRDNLLSRLKTVFNDNYIELFDYTRKLMLSWEQIIKLSQHPLVTFGTHTVNHLVLSSLTADEVILEIDESVRKIEMKTGKPVLYMAYPFGGKNEANGREFEIARKCGLKMAFTAINGNIHKLHAKELASIPRIGLNENWSNSHIDLYVNGFTPLLNKIR